MKKFKVTQYCSTHSEFDINNASSENPLKNYKATGNFWGKFKELALSVQIFNAFNINNTVANQWITDVNTNYAYPVPVRLTGRFFNVKLDFKF